MKDVLSHISEKRKELNKCEFAKWLRDDTQSLLEKMSFAPALLVFIMVFKDFLTSVKSENPTSEIDRIINHHCEEDNGHWKWYLKDLEKLGFSMKTWGQDIPEFFARMYSDREIECRRVGYEVMSYVLRESDRMIHLTVIEVLEATFGVFISSLTHTLRKKGTFENFLFFGQTHEEAESNHDMGNWLGEENSDSALAKFEFESEEAKRKAIEAVDHLFDVFDKMFKTLHVSANTYKYDSEFTLANYSREPAPQPLLN